MNSSAAISLSLLGKNSLFVGNNWTEEWVQECLEVTNTSSTYVVVTDQNIAPLHLQPILDIFSKLLPSSKRILTFVIPPGEAFKTRQQKANIEDFMLSNACTRDSCLIALGGGVVGDLAGFVSSTFMRGISLVQVPTTLLAMVDSSIGGKTAIDTPAGKNLIGAFWQPIRIYIDIGYLKTLPKRQFVNGMSEIIKTGAFWDERLFDQLENYSEAILTSSLSDEGLSMLKNVVLTAAKIKAFVVTTDERELGLRGLLNFGHSVGHAIEAIFTPELLHGEAVSIGMVKEAEIARHLGHLKQVQVARLVRCLKLYGLPTSLEDGLISTIEKETGKRWSTSKILDIMKIDKKNQGKQKKIVLLSGIGSTVEQKASSVDDEVIAKIVSSAVTVSYPIQASSYTITLDIPGSKSISNRALLLAALGEGECRIHGLLHSDDTQVMLQALYQLGKCDYRWENGGDTLVIKGTECNLNVPPHPIYLGNAGTAARFLTTICTLVKESEHGTKTVITGNERMKQRPIGPLVTALRENHSSIEYLENEGCLPLSITAKGGLSGGTIKLAASVSSQYVSSVLISAPYALQSVTLVLGANGDDHVVSQPYIDMTIEMMKSFGVNVTRDAERPNTYYIPKGVYRNPPQYHVEPDASSATYPLAIAAIHGFSVKIQSIGTASLQGDAAFARDVLKPMGCTVIQTENETFVTGPPRGMLKPLPSVDMEPMTDAFLTASVLAAVAQGGDHITKITGISNQRVKECNRILAMVTEFKKFGIESWELPDGIAVKGKSLITDSFLSPNEGVHCYDDHRVAMSFSVLTSALDSCATIIQEKKCVEKTWPQWWDVLERNLGVKIEASDFRETSLKNSSWSSNASIVLIGMRGVGKTTLGAVAAKHLNYKFIDIDQEIGRKYGIIRDMIKENGWEYFRKCESEVFAQVLDTYPEMTVISAGGGVVETDQNLALLKMKRNFMFIIHIDRDIDNIIQELSQDQERPSLGDDLLETYKRRSFLYEEYRNYLFYASSDNRGCYNWPKINFQFVRFLDAIRGKFDENNAPKSKIFKSYDSLRDASYFVSLNIPDLNGVIPNLEKISCGAQALEIRVDCFDFYNDNKTLIKQAASLLHHSNLPLIWTVRTCDQGGNFNSAERNRLKELLLLGIQLGFEYIDVEVCMNSADIDEVLKNKRGCKIIASFHDRTSISPWKNESLILSNMQKAARIGDIVKIVMTASTLQDNFDLYDFLEYSHHVKQLDRPLIAINMGQLGKISRALNLFMTPVTHELLPSVAAPGQLSIKQINRLRSSLGLLEDERFYLFGSPISHSKSPEIHNSAFENVGLDLSLHYELMEANCITDRMISLMRNDEYARSMKWKKFAGASVTIPLKEIIIPHLDELSTSAQFIGAVNTIIPKSRDGNTILIGDNTDWLGITHVLKSKLSSFEKDQKFNVLVLGAGGTAKAACYAATKLSSGVSLYVWNRTVEKASELARNFGGSVLTLESQNSLKFDVIIATIPGDAHDGLPSDILDLYKQAVGVHIELAYKPRITSLIKLAEENNWKIGEGLEILAAQARESFKRWVGH